ncbi:MAG: arsenite efflux transporter metallochaperone ArsD [Bacilli bacterium]|jgi:hypothetical protein
MKIEIYEKPMCCETGLCGVVVDPTLLRMNAIIRKLKANGFDVVRYNLQGNPEQFVENKAANAYLNERGIEGLPVTFLDGKIVKEGSYPSNLELCGYLGIRREELR